MSVELARKALELEAERDKLKAEVERLKGNLSADALAHEAEVSAIRKGVNLQISELKSWLSGQRDQAGQKMDSLIEVGPHAFARGKWDAFSSVLARLDAESRIGAPVNLKTCSDCHISYNPAKGHTCRRFSGSQNTR